jgi:glycosyltransferase involved in cell wall biosynthesis
MASHNLALKVRRADAVVCISDFVRSQLMSLVPPADWARLHTVRCGIDVERFRPPDGPRAAGRGEILTVAAMSPRKGHAVLLAALAELARRGADFGALLVGDGPERPALERLADELGIRARVRFAGALAEEDLPPLYRAADVFCLPSYAEGVPIVLMEAMASELPVVATGVMGVPELVEDGRSGLVVPPGRPDALADALAQLLDDPALRSELGRAARERVRSEYEVGAAAVQLGRVLAGVTGVAAGAPTAGPSPSAVVQ